MSEPTYHGDGTARGDWSQVYTNLDWVAQWMADRGYTDAEIAYVVAQPAVPAVTAEVALAPVEAPVEVPPVLEVFETGERVWTIPLNSVEPDTASEGDDRVGADDIGDTDDTDDPESTERVPA